MWPEPLLETYMTGLVQKTAAGAKPRPFPYRVRVVSDASLNAFTFGGGLLYIHAGLIARMENEAQLVMVLAHEIAHVTERHVTRGIETGVHHAAHLQRRGGGRGVDRRAADQRSGRVVYDATMNAAINGHGRELEREADRIGMDYMVKAGYDPREAPITFELLLKEHGDQPRLVNFFYGSHPANVRAIQHAFRTREGQVRPRRQRKAKLTVNTEEFKRATRGVVIATGRLDYEAAAVQHRRKRCSTRRSARGRTIRCRTTTSAG